MRQYCELSGVEITNWIDNEFVSFLVGRYGILAKDGETFFGMTRLHTNGTPFEEYSIFSLPIWTGRDDVSNDSSHKFNDHVLSGISGDKSMSSKDLFKELDDNGGKYYIKLEDDSSREYSHLELSKINIHRHMYDFAISNTSVERGGFEKLKIPSNIDDFASGGSKWLSDFRSKQRGYFYDDVETPFAQVFSLGLGHPFHHRFRRCMQDFVMNEVYDFDAVARLISETYFLTLFYCKIPRVLHPTRLNCGPDNDYSTLRSLCKEIISLSKKKEKEIKKSW